MVVTKYNIHLYSLDFPGVVIPNPYINVQPSSGLSAGGNINTTITDQFGFGPNPPGIIEHWKRKYVCTQIELSGKIV